MPKKFISPDPKPGVKQDLTGKTFGLLTVIHGNERSSKMAVLWTCKCKCGKFTKTKTQDLKSGHTGSCGCKKRNKGKTHRAWKGFEDISGHFWSTIKNGAISRNLKFNINIEESFKLFLKQNKKCALSGISLFFAKDQRKKSQNPDNNRSSGNASLDRIDSNKGYTKDNIQWVHKDINLIKNKFNEFYFLEICKKIANYKERTMKLKIKKLHESAIIPKYQTKGASGFDLHALEDYTLVSGATILVKTGLAVAVQEGFELQVRPRSGLSLKTPLRVANSPGTVDSDYRGEICVIITNTDTNNGPYKIQYIKKGDRIAQGVICPVLQVEFEEVENLDETDRGSNGYGSTGKA